MDYFANALTNKNEHFHTFCYTFKTYNYISSKSWKERQYNGKKKKEQTTKYKILDSKPKTEQHEPY